MSKLNVRTLTETEAQKYNRMISSVLNCSPEEFFKKYTEYQQAEMAFKELYEPFKEKLLEMYKSTPDLPATIIVGGVKLTYVSPSVRNTIDSKKLKEEEPELAKKFTKTTNVSATIRLD